MVLMLAVLKTWKCYVIDMETAFLYGNLKKLFKTKSVEYEEVIKAVQKTEKLLRMQIM